MIKDIRLTLIVTVMTFTIGCATSSKMNRVALGMNKAQVIDQMGAPDSTKAKSGFEVLEYSLWTDPGFNGLYWIYLQDNKVVKYGQASDFTR